MKPLIRSYRETKNLIKMAVGKRSARLIVDQNASIKELYPGDKVNNWFKEFTGYDLNRLKSLENVIELLHSPRDGSSLAVARIFFGEFVKVQRENC